ncbi:MAG: helix-turn-helix transcriptional regulator [Clostridiales bacterium]|nr:helix-turn-helix transcriptional regulator [Clostridiales bacterium]
MFAERIKELRLEKGLSQQQLADILKVDRTTLVKWENNGHETSFAMLVQIARFFGVSCDYLLGNTDY